MSKTSLLAATLLLASLHSAPLLAELKFDPYVFETNAHGTHPAEVAFLEVPQRHAQPQGPKFRLRVVRLAARAPQANAIPIVYLAGGPGGSGVGTARGARWPIFDQMRATQDVLLLDQRGTGLSDVPPPCPFAFDPNVATFAEARLAAQEVAGQCVKFWRTRNIDLGAYTTRESAHDLAALQQAYGSAKIQLWGMSYGTHLAIAALREHPDRIARAVLMGVEGPDDTLKLPLSADRLYARHAQIIAADPVLHQQYPDLVGDTRKLLEGLRAQPAVGKRWNRHEVQITEFSAQLAISAALGRRDSVRLVPLMVQHARRGDFDLLAEFVFAVQGSYRQVSAMAFAMDMASGASVERLAQVDQQATQSLFGHALNFPYPDIGAKLDLPTLDDGFRAPLTSSIPILIISGELDARTPPANAENLGRGLANYSHVRIVNALHDDDLWLSHKDIAPIIKAFFEGAPVKTQVLRAAVPDYATSVLGEIWHQAKILVMAVLGALVGMLSLGGWWLHRRKRRRKPVMQ